MGFDIKLEEPCLPECELVAVPISDACAAAINYVQCQSWGARRITDTMAILDLRARNRGLELEWAPTPRSLSELLAEFEHVTNILRSP